MAVLDTALFIVLIVSLLLQALPIAGQSLIFSVGIDDGSLW